MRSGTLWATCRTTLWKSGSYGFTEMFNNAMEHANGTRIGVAIRRTAASTEMLMTDNGVGIFRKIQTELGLLDARHAILELSKGKLTTDPARHTGEGISFSSRMFDRFDITSEGACFSHSFEGSQDWIEEGKPEVPGNSSLDVAEQPHGKNNQEGF